MKNSIANGATFDFIVNDLTEVLLEEGRSRCLHVHKIVRCITRETHPLQRVLNNCDCMVTDQRMSLFQVISNPLLLDRSIKLVNSVSNPTRLLERLLSRKETTAMITCVLGVQLCTLPCWFCHVINQDRSGRALFKLWARWPPKFDSWLIDNFVLPLLWAIFQFERSRDAPFKVSH